MDRALLNRGTIQADKLLLLLAIGHVHLSLAIHFSSDKWVFTFFALVDRVDGHRVLQRLLVEPAVWVYQFLIFCEAFNFQFFLTNFFDGFL